MDGRQTNEQQYNVKGYMAGDRAKLGQGAQAERSLSGDLTQVSMHINLLHVADVLNF